MTVLWLDGSRRPVSDFRQEAARHSEQIPSERLFARLRKWRRRSRERAELAALDNRMLADIGISRAEAEFLANKPFWRE